MRATSSALSRVVDADLVAPDGDRVAAELEHGHLGRVAGPVGRFLEDQRHAPPGQDRGGYSSLGQVEDGRQLARRQVVDIEKVRHHAALQERRGQDADASSISSSVTSKRGFQPQGRRGHRVDDQARLQAAAATAPAFPVASSAASSSPRPRTAPTPAQRLNFLLQIVAPASARAGHVRAPP